MTSITKCIVCRYHSYRNLSQKCLSGGVAASPPDHLFLTFEMASKEIFSTGRKADRWIWGYGKGFQWDSLHLSNSIF
jgi:hypothetical protein